MSVCQYAHTCRCLQRQEAVGSTGAGVIGSYEPPHVLDSNLGHLSEHLVLSPVPRQLSFFLNPKFFHVLVTRFVGKICVCVCVYVFMKVCVCVWPEVHFRSHVLLELAS